MYAVKIYHNSGLEVWKVLRTSYFGVNINAYPQVVGYKMVSVATLVANQWGQESWVHVF